MRVREIYSEATLLSNLTLNKHRWSNGVMTFISMVIYIFIRGKILNKKI